MDDVLKAYEAAARLYCQKTDMDPDTLIPQPHPILLGSTVEVPAWHLAARELHDLSIKLVSLKEAAAAQKIVVQ